MVAVKRWLFNLLADGSLLLFVVTAMLWVRTYWQTDIFGASGIGWEFQAASPKGSLMLEWRWLTGSNVNADSGFGMDLRYPPLDAGSWNEIDGFQTVHDADRIGFGGGGFTVMKWTQADPTWRIILPLWSCLALTAVLPAIRIREQRRRRSRRDVGRCKMCGYDLRASPERCPECGTPIVESPLLS